MSANILWNASESPKSPKFLEKSSVEFANNVKSCEVSLPPSSVRTDFFKLRRGASSGSMVIDTVAMLLSCSPSFTINVKLSDRIESTFGV